MLRSVLHRLFGSASAILISVVIMMAIGIFILLGMQFQASWRQLAHADRISVLAAADHQIFEVTSSIRVDRGTLQTGLLAEDDPHALLTMTFAAGDKRWDDLMRGIPSDLTPNTPSRLATLNAAWARATALRGGLMAIAAKPRAERKLSDTKEWFDALTAVVTGMNDYSSRVAGAARVSDPTVGENVQARQFAWAARIAVGDECGTVRSSFGTGTPLTAAQRTAATEARGRANQSMAALQELLSRPEAPQVLEDARVAASNEIQSGFKARDAAYENLGTPKQLDGPAWEKQCVGVLDPILKIGSIALDRLTAYAADNRAGALQELVISGGVLVAVSLGIAASLLLVRGRIIRPVALITAAIRRLAAREIHTAVVAPRHDDEFGAMAVVLEELRQSAVEAERLVKEREISRAANDRRQAAMDRHTADFGQTIAGVMTSLMRSAEQMRTSATAMSEGARQTRTDAAATAEGAASSSRDLGSVASASEEMAASIAEIARQVAGVTDAVRLAVTRASVTDEKVTGLAETAERIGEVVRLISDIAGRTNLLALNATIEAARAGEAGRGFAVVAGEVKALATQTAKATEEISAQVAAIRGATDEAVASVREVTGAISQVNTVAEAIGATIGEQAAATRGIAGGVQNVLQSSGEATASMQKVSSIAEEAEVTSRGVLSAADEVGRTADALREDVEQFLKAMANSNETDRRRYERIGGSGSRAKLRAPGRGQEDVAIEDISRGGVALRCGWPLAVGTDVEIALPDGAGDVAGRVVRTGANIVAITFRQDGASLERIDRALDAVTRRGARKAA
jgi:methyl-accepting chemotaxis protein